MNYNILVINPGSTSTKVAIFKDNSMLISENIQHTNEEIKQFTSVIDQYCYRKELILKFVKTAGFDIKQLSAVVGRGGLIKPVAGGTYLINQAMVDDLKVGILGMHASNLGGIIAYDIALLLNIPSFIVDPVVVNELQELATFSGHKDIKRISIFHALNQKAVARQVSKEINKSYQDSNFIVAHLGGGISVGVHHQGRVIDVNNALHGEGPFSPERTGSLPVVSVVEFCLANQLLNKDAILKHFVGNGGFVSYLGTNQGKEIQQKIAQGDSFADLVLQAMAYQIAKEIGACAMVLSGNYDAIILTGGLAYWHELVERIRAYIGWMNIPIKIIAGENEIEALALGALRVMKKEEQALEYI